jgi:hypothetical protein
LSLSGDGVPCQLPAGFKAGPQRVISTLDIQFFLMQIPDKKEHIRLLRQLPELWALSWKVRMTLIRKTLSDLGVFA